MEDLIKYLEKMFCGEGKRDIIVPMTSSQIDYLKKLEYNTDKSAEHPTDEGEDIVRYSFEKRRMQDKEPACNN
jgi:hypothetical protein